MNAKITKIIRKAARFHAFLQVQRSRTGRPINDATDAQVRAEDLRQLKLHNERSERMMIEAWEGSSDKGRKLLRKKWEEMIREGDKKPTVESKPLFKWPPSSTNLFAK